MTLFSWMNLFSDKSFIHKRLKGGFPEEGDSLSTGQHAQNLQRAAILGSVNATQENGR